MLWSTAFGPGTEADMVLVEAFSLDIPIDAGDLAAVGAQMKPVIRRLFREGGGAIQAGPQEMTMGGLPALRFQGTGTLRDGTAIDSTLVYVFDGSAVYRLDCQHTRDGAREVQAACGQVIRTFKASGPPPPAAGIQRFQSHGVSFDYPATLAEGTLTGAAGNGPRLWGTALAATTENFIGIGADRLSAPVTAGHLAAITPAADRAARRFMRQIRGVMQAGPQRAAMGRLPALRFRGATTVYGVPIGVTLVFAFDGRTQYFAFCVHTRAGAAQIGRAFGQIMRTFQTGKATQPVMTLALSQQ